ncbi:hypothetical protein GCM10018963_73590 [Saccharothrix longispora]
MGARGRRCLPEHLLAGLRSADPGTGGRTTGKRTRLFTAGCAERVAWMSVAVQGSCRKGRRCRLAFRLLDDLRNLERPVAESRCCAGALPAFPEFGPVEDGDRLVDSAEIHTVCAGMSSSWGSRATRAVRSAGGGWWRSRNRELVDGRGVPMINRG